MNCPRCLQSVGHDEYGYSKWGDEAGPNGEIAYRIRYLSVRCAHCGVFESLVDSDGRVRRTRGPIVGARARRPVEARIPGAQSRAAPLSAD